MTCAIGVETGTIERGAVRIEKERVHTVLGLAQETGRWIALLETREIEVAGGITDEMTTEVAEVGPLLGKTAMNEVLLALDTTLAIMQANEAMTQTAINTFPL